MRKSCFTLAIILLLTNIFTVPAFASNNISSVDRLSVDSQIKGVKAEYTMDVPDSWKRYVVVERENLLESSLAVEKLIFTYKPVSTSTQKALIINIYIFKKGDWDSSAGFKKLTGSDKYDMVYETTTINPFVFGSDKLIFETLLKEAQDISFFKDYISFPEAQDEFIMNTISVNGKRMSSKSYVTSLNIMCVPVREVCEALGYSVGWVEKDQTVTISNGSFFTDLGFNLNKNKKYNVLNINGKAYVSTMFFLISLKCSVEIDENSNVRITK